MKFDGSRKAAQNAGRWFQQVEGEISYSCRNDIRWRDAPLQSDTQRPRQHYQQSASLNGGGRGRGGVLSKRLKSGAGHNRTR